MKQTNSHNSDGKIMQTKSSLLRSTGAKRAKQTGTACDCHLMNTPDAFSNIPVHGLIPRAYAAIQLRVPESGIDWLDAMIVKANRTDIVHAVVMSGRWCGRLESGLEYANGYDYRHVLAIAEGLRDAMRRGESKLIEGRTDSGNAPCLNRERSCPEQVAAAPAS